MKPEQWTLSRNLRAADLIEAKLNLSDEQLKTVISNAIGFDFDKGALQYVNDHDLLHIARKVLELVQRA